MIANFIKCGTIPKSQAINYSYAMRYGVARGVFTNEAGLGTSSIVHAAAEVDHPARQGMWGILEVFLDTVFLVWFFL